MHGYEEDLDEEAGYDDYYSDDNGLDEYEDDEEEEQEVPPKEELEYLELRQKIKESIRKKQGKGSVQAQSSSQDRRKKLPYNDFGSFFGPSRPAISSRVIQEKKSLLENEIKNSTQPKKRPAPANSSGGKSVSQEKRPRPVSAVRKKVETLKDTRDYSFLFSDDAELPVPKREPLSRGGSFLNSESRSAQLSARPKQQPSGINNGRAAHGPPPPREKKKRPVVSANGHSRPSSSGSQMNHSRPSSSGSQMNHSRPMGSQMQSRPVSGRPAPPSGGNHILNSRPAPSGSQMQQRAASSGGQRPGSSANRQAPMRPPGSSMNGQSANRNVQPSSRIDPQRSAPAKVPIDHRRQMSSSGGHGVGPARSVSTSKPLPSKSSSSERRPSMSAGKSSLQSAQRPSSRPISSDPRQRLAAEQQRKVSRDPTTSRMIPKQSAPSSKHQMMSKPAAKRPPPQREIDDRRPLKKKRPMSEDDKALSMIRQMFNTDRYAGRDYDDRGMEAGFEDIMKEERRSARIAREEDEREAQLIAEEEERERQRKLRKLRR